MFDLMLSDCSHCGGEGHVIFDAGTSSETFACCSYCDGDGEVEVCAGCRQPVDIWEGREVCGCSALALPQAA